MLMDRYSDVLRAAPQGISANSRHLFEALLSAEGRVVEGASGPQGGVGGAYRSHLGGETGKLVGGRMRRTPSPRWRVCL